MPFGTRQRKGQKGAQETERQRDTDTKTKTKRMTLVIRSALWSCGEGGIGYCTPDGRSA